MGFPQGCAPRCCNFALAESDQLRKYCDTFLKPCWKVMKKMTKF
jgi:hypothetical protein